MRIIAGTLLSTIIASVQQWFLQFSGHNDVQFLGSSEAQKNLEVAQPHAIDVMNLRSRSQYLEILAGLPKHLQGWNQIHHGI